MQRYLYSFKYESNQNSGLDFFQSPCRPRHRFTTGPHIDSTQRSRVSDIYSRTRIVLFVKYPSETLPFAVCLSVCLSVSPSVRPTVRPSIRLCLVVTGIWRSKGDMRRPRHAGNFKFGGKTVMYYFVLRISQRCLWVKLYPVAVFILMSSLHSFDFVVDYCTACCKTCLCCRLVVNLLSTCYGFVWICVVQQAVQQNRTSSVAVGFGRHGMSPPISNSDLPWNWCASRV